MKQSTEPRVLIIEDNDALRAMLFTILRHQPVAVDTASSADEGWSRISTCDYALVIIDADLPKGQCQSFLTRFARERSEATTFVLAVRDPRSEEYLDPAVVSAVMVKPLEIDTLAEVVRECALVIPPPENPMPCPPADSDIRTRMERSPFMAN